MGWIADVLLLFKRNTLEELKQILAERKEQLKEYKAELKEVEARIADLQSSLYRVEQLEMDCLEKQVALVVRVRDLEEELLVVTKWMKSKS